MTKRVIAVLSLAGASAAVEVSACPNIPVCVPQACVDMRHLYTDPAAAGARGGGASTAAVSLNMVLQSQMPITAIGGAAGIDGSSLYGWVDPQTSREYAIMGRENGTAVVDITVPTQPKYVANIASAGSNTLWREPKVYGNYAYIGVDGGSHRMQIVDLTQVRAYAGTTLNLNYGTYSASHSGGIVTAIHTLQINKDSGYLYLSGTNRNSGSPLIVDVRNPGNPVPAGAVPPTGTGWGDGYSHETQVVTYNGPDTAHVGKEIMVSSNGRSDGSNSLSVVDVTNKAALTRLSSRVYSGAQYIHQGWFTEDQRFFIQNDELDEPGNPVHGTRSHVWDMSDLDNPVYKGFRDNTTASIDHNLYITKGFMFQTNYTSGLRMMKLGNLESSNPQDWWTEVAYYDTYLPNDGASFAGAWNNYPFFPSGNIAISDINGGLFVVRPTVAGWGPSFQGLGLPNPFFNIGPWVLAPEPSSALALVSAALVLCRRHRR